MADVSYVDWVEFPHVRLRVEMDRDGGDVTRFVVQLEYRLENGWSPVVRFDHDPDAAMGHDITDEGLHVDVYRDGKKYDVVDSFPEVPLSVAPRYCIGYVEAHLDRLLRGIRKMARPESGPERREGTVSDGEIEAFREAIDELGKRVSEVLAEGTETTPEEIEAVVDDLETPDE